MKLSYYHVATRPVDDGDERSSVRVVMATRSGKVCVIDDADWALLEAGRFDLVAAADLALFRDIGLVVDSREDELKTIISENDAAAEQAGYYLVIQPTALCQLGCDYCGQSHTPTMLSQAHCDALVERARREFGAGRFRSLSVCWFGGEPLLAMPVVRDLSRRLMALAAEAGRPYRAKLVTNGLSLNEDFARELVEDFKVDDIEVTLDGDARAHNARRFKKHSREPTFDRIFANLLRLAESAPPSLGITLRCNVDARNAESIFRLADRLAEAKVQSRIGLYIAAVYSWGNNAHELSLTREDFADLELRFLDHLARLGFHLHLLPRRRKVPCLAFTDSGKVVDAFGGVYNCTEVSYVASYGSPNIYSQGTITTRRASPKAAALRDFNELIAGDTLPCHTCRMLPVCGGSCPKKWLEGYIACPPSKINIEGKLLLALAQERVGGHADP